MKKEIAIVVTAIILLSVLTVLPVISGIGAENATDVCIPGSRFENTKDNLLSGAFIANQTNISESNRMPLTVVTIYTPDVYSTVHEAEGNASDRYMSVIYNESYKETVTDVSKTKDDGDVSNLLSEAPTSGSWSGTTSEGKDISFNVSGLQVYKFTIESDYSCSSGRSGFVNIIKFIPIDIVGNVFQDEFSQADSTTVIYGEFTTSKSAIGTFRNNWTTTQTHYPYVDSCDTGIITWTASPQTPEPTPTLTRIEVIPSTKTLDVGDTQQFTATAYDQYDAVMSNIDITWTSSNTAVGIVSPASATTGSDGKATTTFTASASGATTVKAAHGTVSGTASVTVGQNGDSVCKIAFSSDRDDVGDIYVMDADGTNVKRLTSNTALDLGPAWSPDCKKIAFQSNRDGDYEIYVMNANGSNVIPLTSNTAYDVSSDWSPDGSKIAFHSDRDGDDEIYVMDADGTNVKQLTSNWDTYDGTPVWSPDGSKIAFHSDRDGDDEIYVMNADGTNVKQLTSNWDTYDVDAAWSPDGSKIAFFSDRDGDYEIYVMDADGTNVKRLTSNSAMDWLPTWSPDGNKIAFASDRDGYDYEIYVMDADGTNVKQLTSNSADDFEPAWCCIDSKATVSIESASAPKGSTVTVPIRIKNVTNLATTNIWLSYNKDMVIVESVSEGDLSPVTPAIDNATGVTKMNWFSATGKNGDFVFAYVTLKAIGSAGQSSSLDLDVKELGDTSANAISHTVEDGTFTMKMSVFDTGESANPYPSISGTHYGTLTPSQTITVSSLYTYPCAGTGGHSEYAKLWNDTWTGEKAFWDEYQGNWHSIAFDEPFTLFAGKEYYYEIRTGSYPQIHHTNALPTAKGWINCSSFVDANGKEYNGWIPAIKLA